MFCFLVLVAKALLFAGCQFSSLQCCGHDRLDERRRLSRLSLHPGLRARRSAQIFEREPRANSRQETGQDCELNAAIHNLHTSSIQLAEYVHIFTLGISRPYGAAIFLTAYDEKVRFVASIQVLIYYLQRGPQIFLVEPSGLCYEYKAWAVGKHRQAAKTEIEKLKLDELSMEQLVRETARILITIRDEAKDKNLRVEMGWVGKHTNGRHELIPADKVADAEKWAKSKLEEEDMEE